MPIEYRIDSERRIVIARGYGTFTHADVLRYQRDVWSRPELAGYDELVDMSHVELIALSSTGRLREVARTPLPDPVQALIVPLAKDWATG
jgi:hypothetical protein